MDMKSWIETEMDETSMLVRKKLKELNEIDADDVDSETLHDLDKCYKILYRILEIQAHIKKM